MLRRFFDLLSLQCVKIKRYFKMYGFWGHTGCDTTTNAREACIPWLVGVVDGGGGKLFERCCIRNHLVLALVATRFQLPFLCLSASTS